MPLVYVVILNYKNWQDVAECLESVFRLQYDNYKIFVVDNDSGNHSLEQLSAWVKKNNSISDANDQVQYQFFKALELNGGINLQSLPQLVFVQNDRNEGFASGNNIILQHLVNTDAYIWLLNPDMVVEPNTLSELVSFAGKSPYRSVIGAVIKYYSDPGKVLLYGGAKINFNSATIDPVTDEKDIPGIDFICGGSMFAHAGHFKDLGLLPEDYFLYWEETDWCYRAKQKGYKMLVCTNAVCFDKISSTIGKSFIGDFYYTRNGLLFTSKFKRNRLSLVFFSAVLRFIKRILTGKWKRAMGVYKGMLAFSKRNKNEHQ